MHLKEARKRYPADFLDPAQFSLPPGVVPFTGDPLNEDTHFDPSESLEIPSGASRICPLHNRYYRFSDRWGSFYCNDAECWSRYRLLLTGSEYDYPAVSVVYDPRNHLPDLSAIPSYIPAPTSDAHLIAVYPPRTPVSTLLIPAGELSWKEFAAQENYLRIAMALRSLDWAN